MKKKTCRMVFSAIFALSAVSKFLVFGFGLIRKPFLSTEVTEDTEEVVLTVLHCPCFLCFPWRTDFAFKI